MNCRYMCDLRYKEKGKGNMAIWSVHLKQTVESQRVQWSPKTKKSKECGKNINEPDI